MLEKSVMGLLYLFINLFFQRRYEAPGAEQDDSALLLGSCRVIHFTYSLLDQRSLLLLHAGSLITG